MVTHTSVDLYIDYGNVEMSAVFDRYEISGILGILKHDHCMIEEYPPDGEARG